MSSRSGSGRHLATRALLILSVFCVLSIFSARASAQSDPRLVDAIRQAQEGRGDSARTKVRRLLSATSPTDTLYPQIIYTQAMVASEANEMRRQLQRVAVEYSSSSWADDALLRLVQLDYASGNLEGAARNLERIRSDYPGSSLLPQASYWAARTYFDQKSPELACRWIAEGLAGSQGNIELHNQLGYLNQRCAGVRVDVAAQPPVDSQPTLASGGTDTAAPPQTSVPAPAPSTGSSAPPAAAPTQVEPSAPPPARPEPRVPEPSRTEPPPPTAPVATRPTGTASRYRIQITAVRTPVTAEALVARLRRQGLAPVTVQESGLYKVRVGDYATRADAMSALPELKAKLGGSLFVVAEP